MNKAIKGLTYDYFIHNRFYLECTWNNDFTKIIKMKRLGAETIRIFDIDTDFEPISYMYCFDYRQAINWVGLDSDMGTYHKANIVNSLNPSLLVEFYNVPDTDEKKQQTLSNINASFAGPSNTGRAMVFFSPDKDSAPSVTQMEPNKLDKTFLGLTDTIQRQVLFAHNLNPDLMGLKTPGSLGQNAGQLEEIKNQFLNSVIIPAQNEIENEINYLASFNGLCGFTLKESNI